MRTVTRLLLTLLCLGLLAVAYERLGTDRLMVDAAKTYITSLNADQKKLGIFKLEDDEERMHWLYTPNPRNGLTIRQMSKERRLLAEALLSAGLSAQGLIKAHTIMSLDQVLLLLEKDMLFDRDTDKYFLSIFGEPSEKGVWGYRFEGHHVSLNYTVVNGKIASTPNFWGSNPAEVREGRRKGLRVLARQEDLGRKLVESLTPEQRATAIVDAKAYNDILTTNSRKAALSGQPNGLAFAKMTAPQKAMLEEVVAEYAYDFPAEVTEQRMAQYRKTQASAFFAWAGGTAATDKHYYRVQTAEFVIEFDKTQDEANHIHSVWRDFTNDFGGDLLAAHYKASH
jgi:hypothetical protein